MTPLYSFEDISLAGSGRSSLVLLLFVDRELRSSYSEATTRLPVPERRLDEAHPVVQLVGYVVDVPVRHRVPTHGPSWCHIRLVLQQVPNTLVTSRVTE
jgi:hypothetical protein